MGDVIRDWDGFSDGKMLGLYGKDLDRPAELPKPAVREWNTFVTEMYNLPCEGGERKIVLCLAPITKLIVYGHKNYLFHKTFRPGEDDAELSRVENEVWDTFQAHYAPKVEKVG